MNRFQLAKTLNYSDELVWYVKHQGRMLKCLWRNYTDPDLVSPGKVELTFVAQWMDTEKVYRVFTAEYDK